MLSPLTNLITHFLWPAENGLILNEEKVSVGLNFINYNGMEFVQKRCPYSKKKLKTSKKL